MVLGRLSDALRHRRDPRWFPSRSENQAMRIGTVLSMNAAVGKVTFAAIGEADALTGERVMAGKFQTMPR